MPPTASNETKKLYKIFRKMDTSRTGTLSVNEFRDGLVAAGHSASAYQGMFQAIDANGDGMLTFEEVLRELHPKRKDAFYREQLEALGLISAHEDNAGSKVDTEQMDEIREIFAIYDADGSGTITLGELKKALEGGSFSDAEIGAMFEQMDENHDNTVSFAEFVKASLPL